MTKPIHTPWMTESPVRAGVYQRRRPEHLHVPNRTPRLITSFALYEGDTWYTEARSPAKAELATEESAFQTNVEWRGRTEA